MMMKVLCLLTFASLTASHAAPDAITESTCTKCVEMNKTTDLTYCYDSLEDTSDSESKDLKGLGLLAIRRVEKSAKASVKMIQAILDRSDSNDIDFNMLTQCMQSFEGAVNDAGATKIIFSKGDYEAVTAKVFDLHNAARDCVDSWNNGKTLPVLLDNENLELNKLANIVDCIATLSMQ